MKPLTPLGTLAVACSIFFAVGVVMAGISPSLKTLAGNAGADLVVIGSLTTALFFGGILSQLAAGPLSDRIAVYSSVMYMHQSGTEGGPSSFDEAWSFTVGIAIHPRANSRSTTVAGRRWAPLLPVANNGSFLIDGSATY